MINKYCKIQFPYKCSKIYNFTIKTVRISNKIFIDRNCKRSFLFKKITHGNNEK